MTKKNLAEGDALTAILAAAERVVAREGVARMTIDGVAREAKLSKGGVLYHFSTKEALIKAMIDRLLAEFERDVGRFLEKDKDAGPGRWTRAYVRATLSAPPSPIDKSGGTSTQAFGAALIAALAVNPSLLAEYQGRLREWQRRLESDGIDQGRALVVSLAADGLWLYELLGLWRPTKTQRRQVAEELLQLIGDSPAGKKTKTPSGVRRGRCDA